MPDLKSNAEKRSLSNEMRAYRTWIATTRIPSIFQKKDTQQLSNHNLYIWHLPTQKRKVNNATLRFELPFDPTGNPDPRGFSDCFAIDISFLWMLSVLIF
jgi:hypothetical protein